MSKLRGVAHVGGAARGLASALILLLLLGCGCRPQRSAPRNLVLVTIDTLRRDHLGSYGFEDFEQAISPNLDRLAAHGVRFDDALAQAISTPPSHASILTGLNPPRHGLRALSGQRLSDANLTLAEILGQAGFATAAFVSAVPLRRDTGLDQGFSSYDDSFAAEASERSASETNAEVRSWLKTRPEGRLFLWVHYFDPHGQYYPPREYREAFGVKEAQRDRLPPGRNNNPDTGKPEQAPFPAQFVGLMRRLYAAEVLYTDHAVGELMQLLEEHGILEDAIVAVVADHGECLGERGYYFGHWDVFDETTRLPLILIHPHRPWAGRSVSAPVATVDLVPTFLAWLGVPAPSRLDGIDLTSLIEGAPASSRAIYTEQQQVLRARSVRDASWALIEHPERKTHHLYARNNGALTEPTIGDTEAARIRLTAAMKRLRSRALGHPTEHVEVPESVEEQLRGLGYVE